MNFTMFPCILNYSQSDLDTLNFELSHNIESSDSITAAMLNDNSKLNSDELTLWQATHGLVFLGWYW